MFSLAIIYTFGKKSTEAAYVPFFTKLRKTKYKKKLHNTKTPKMHYLLAFTTWRNDFQDVTWDVGIAVGHGRIFNNSVMSSVDGIQNLFNSFALFVFHIGALVYVVCLEIVMMMMDFFLMVVLKK